MKIYTIGHGNKKAETFLAELASFGIEFVLDIRSKPYSKWSPHFNRDELQDLLKQNNIRYVYFGDSLGGLPSDRSCYDGGKVNYSTVQEKDFFKAGIARLHTAADKGYKVALMCSESAPGDCHRSKLIGEVLLEDGIEVIHITGSNLSISQNEAILEATGGAGTEDLFGSVDLTSRKRYE
ncbi:DUF488 domain-containing protein [Thiopseudomonas alkaliphila]|uniref:DUF488 domain-containing protein n=1 Tax=Thiopseudomonas alkaliphila TaxID=1697053 RepID=UPI002574A8DF|nr:DUF488 domain-containing protein [Thiopseudomonas alkaliphila]MDM1708360.1 DUF488 domain-containing protein [Thiopseudomonas alkaliphila]